jgi:predicted nucleic acid-binding protein
MIFLDTDFFINLYVESNENHERAKEICILIENETLVIANLTIMEVMTVLNVKLKQKPQLLLKVYNELTKGYKIVNDTSFHENGFKIFMKELNENNTRLPLFDCVYMALIKKLGITSIVSFDKHFDNKGIIRIH